MADRGGDIPFVPYIVYDEAVAQHERMCKRLWVTIILLIVSLVLSNGFWIYRETQFEDIEITQEGEADNGSDLVLMGTGTGNNYGGESETDN